jgi:hypothetical protein
MAEEPFLSLGTFLAIGSFAISLLVTVGVVYWYFSARAQTRPFEQAERESADPQMSADAD